MRAMAMIVLTMAGVFCLGCGKDSSSSPTSTGVAAPTPVPTSPAQQTAQPSTSIPICNDVADCIQSCMIANPNVSDDAVSSLCQGSSAFQGICNTLASKNDAAYQNFMKCLALPYNQAPNYSGSSNCANSFPYTSAAAIQQAAAANGTLESSGTIIAIYSNQLAIAQYNACIAISAP